MSVDIYGVSIPILYDDLLCDFMKLFATDPCQIIFETADHYKKLIHMHLVRVHGIFRPKKQFFTEGMDWLNTSKNIYLDDDLKGKILILDFFTYCCINCIHILPYLKIVEEEYARNCGISVIGVHSPKFPQEKHLHGVMDALVRNNIEHPVVNDPDGVLWKKFNVTCWPTVVILGPEHELLFILIGETEINKLPFIVRHVVQYYDSHGAVLSTNPLPLTAVEKPQSKFGLMYPAGISSMGTFVLLSDTGNNRLVLFTLQGRIEEIIGTGKVGCKDGPFNRASFNSPHGTVWRDFVIYVADTGNHSIRKIDLKKKIVTTVFKGKDYVTHTVDTSTDYEYTSNEDDLLHRERFRSPWDVCIGPRFGSNDAEETSTLYIAVAGAHQIWSLDLDSENIFVKCTPCAGSGKEENRNNLYALRAGFAQPSGIEYSPLFPFYLFVADSESSTVKSINLLNGAVKTIVGGDRDPLNLFEYGDTDGVGIDAKLQHPLSVCVMDNDYLVITDTYNHKIKMIKVQSKDCFTYELQESAVFSEPSAICFTSEGLFVADTNNHRIQRILIMENKAMVFPIMREEVQYTELEYIKPSADPNLPKTKVEIKLEGEVRCSFELKMDPKYKISEEEPQPWDIVIRGEGRFVISCLTNSLLGYQQPALVLRCDNTEHQSSLDPVESEVSLTITIPLCDSLFKTCRLASLTYKFIVECSATACKYADVRMKGYIH